VVIPVYNAGEFLPETLASVEQQTLDKELFEVIVVDDGSTDGPTLTLLDDMRNGMHLPGVATTVLRHDKNRSLAEARNTGVRAARGRYICLLDADDLIAFDYLKKGLLLLEASFPRAGWIYPAVRKFGHVNKLDEAPEFSAYQLFRRNHCGSACIIRKAMWESIGGQRHRIVYDDVGWFEDWDFWIRGMAAGWYGIPLQEPMHLYRQHLRSLITRDRVALRLTNYLVHWYNIPNLPRIRRAQRNHALELKAGRVGSPTRLTLRDLPNRLAGRAIALESERGVALFPWTMLVRAAVAPRRFIDRVLRTRVLPTRAELLCGFESKPSWTPPADALAPVDNRRTILFAHNWWRIGGAQRVLLDWMSAAHGVDGVRVVEVVERTGSRAVPANGNGAQEAGLREDFAALAHEQHALDRLPDNPLTALRYCWELLRLERPRVLFIMSNPFFYVLAPFIKQCFPQTTIVDLLHCEDNDNPGWFGTAYEYQQALDGRIVISDYWKHVLVERYGEDPQKIRVAMNGVDVSRFDPQQYDREELRHRAGIDARKCVVAFIGRLDPQKGPETFLELAALMQDDNDYELIMVGDGALARVVRERAGALSNLRLFGEVQNTAPFYALADVVVCPSVYEGHPLVGLEAAAMNVPVVATNVAGFREQLRDGGFGILYQQHSSLKDALTLSTILRGNRFRWEELGRRGRTFVTEHYDIRTQRGAYRDILEELLRSDASPPATARPDATSPAPVAPNDGRPAPAGTGELQSRRQLPWQIGSDDGAPAQGDAITDAELIRAYARAKHLRHVWVYSVGGRCSSTALQRLLNSSNEICIFGEPWGAVNTLLKAISTLEGLDTERRRTLTAEHYQLLVDSFARGRHDRFYSNAFRPLDDTLLILKGTLANLLRPVNGARRFGFKDISSPGEVEVIKTLHRTFPASQTLFLFRDPRLQWKSVRGARWFPYSDNLTDFLEVYERISTHYLRFAGELQQPHFVENQDLFDRGKVLALVRFLGVGAIDETLIGLTVSSEGETASDDAADVQAIEDSAAYRNYVTMCELAERFFGSLAK